MTVKELMEQLKRYPDDYTISIEYDNCNENYGYEYLYIKEMYKNDKEVIIEVW